MSSSRDNILARLRAAAPVDHFVASEPAMPPSMELSRAEKVARLKQRMETMHAEVVVTAAGAWLDALKIVLRNRKLNGLLYAPATALGQELAAAWDSDLPPLVGYIEDVEQSKEQLFAIDASITAVERNANKMARVTRGWTASPASPTPRVRAAQPWGSAWASCSGSAQRT